jgi:hypothetical protein
MPVGDESRERGLHPVGQLGEQHRRGADGDAAEQEDGAPLPARRRHPHQTKMAKPDMPADKGLIHHRVVAGLGAWERDDKPQSRVFWRVLPSNVRASRPVATRVL